MRIIRTILLAVFCVAAIWAQCVVSGTITDHHGTPLPGGVVRFYNESTLGEVAVGIDDHTGKYTSPVLPCPASYTITVDRSGSAPYKRTKQPLSAPATTVNVVLFPVNLWPLSEQAGAIFLTFIFAITLILFRWNNIALLDQKQLGAEVAMTRARLDLEADLPAKQKQVDILKVQLTEALAPFTRRGKALEGGENPVTCGTGQEKLDFWFWTRGHESASWMRVREVQRLLIEVWPPHSTERLRAGLQRAQQTLWADKSQAAAGFGVLVRDALSTNAPDDHDEERWKQLLLEVTDYINVTREAAYSDVSMWQSKAAWLAITACVLIVATVAARGQGMLFLAGAAGGFMSRLARALKATDTPTDYGASWNTLFLSPLLGSLAGFFGVLMIQGLGTGGVIDNALNGTPLALPALAFLLGFSERLFDSIVSALDKSQPAATPAAPAPASAPASQLAAVTSVRDIQPFPALPGELVTVSGKGLEAAKVDGIALTAQDKSDVKPGNLVQEAEQIRFNLPQNLPDGSYILTVKAKDAPFISKTVRVHQLPVLDTDNPTTATAGTVVTFKGKGLDPDVKVELFDPAGKPVTLTDLTQSPAAITFTAPATAGNYKLTLTLGNRTPLVWPVMVPGHI